MADYAPVRTDIAARIEAAGWSQKVFAGEIGVSAAYLSDFLRGRRDLSAPLARKIGAALGVDGEALFLRQAAELYRIIER